MARTCGPDSRCSTCPSRSHCNSHLEAQTNTNREASRLGLPDSREVTRLPAGPPWRQCVGAASCHPTQQAQPTRMLRHPSLRSQAAMHGCLACQHWHVDLLRNPLTHMGSRGASMGTGFCLGCRTTHTAALLLMRLNRRAVWWWCSASSARERHPRTRSLPATHITTCTPAGLAPWLTCSLRYSCMTRSWPWGAAGPGTG